MDWEPKINDKPPSRARAIAILSSETACIIEETSGMLRLILGLPPFLNLVSGVFKETAEGICFTSESLGINRYSLKVRDGSS